MIYTRVCVEVRVEQDFLYEFDLEVADENRVTSLIKSVWIINGPCLVAVGCIRAEPLNKGSRLGSIIARLGSAHLINEPKLKLECQARLVNEPNLSTLESS